MTPESRLLSQIRATLGRREDVRLFRNQCGFYKEGNRAIRYGIPGPGGADLLGWKTITVDQTHVGKKLSVFVAIEVKANSRLTPLQENFLAQVKAFGGIAGVAHSVDDAVALIASVGP